MKKVYVDLESSINPILGVLHLFSSYLIDSSVSPLIEGSTHVNFYKFFIIILCT